MAEIIVRVDVEEVISSCNEKELKEVLESIPISDIMKYVHSFNVNLNEKELAMSYYRNELDLKALIREIGKENIESALKGM